MKHQYIFIGGLHRSGTSLLSAILKAHPLVSGFERTGVDEDEGQFLQSVYPIARLYGGVGRFGFHPKAHLTEKSPLNTPANAEKITESWNNYWDLNKPYLLEKSPPNLLKTRFLQALFPSSKFIIIYRHPLAVAYATQKWRARMPIWLLIAHWLVCYQRFENDKPYLKNCLLVRYEELVAQPQMVMDYVYQFLELTSQAITDDIRSDINAAYFIKWSNKPAIIKWLYKFWLEKKLNKYGYSFKP